jgi:uncharacterized protein
MASTHVGSSFVDGGVWANNPVLAAVVEAVCFLDVSMDQIDVLSIGTTGAAIELRRWKQGKVGMASAGEAG